MSAKSVLAITPLHDHNRNSMSCESWDSTDSNDMSLITLRPKLTETAAKEEQK